MGFLVLHLSSLLAPGAADLGFWERHTDVWMEHFYIAGEEVGKNQRSKDVKMYAPGARTDWSSMVTIPS
ncbi:hypothetical protein PsorP6_001680 [Peronosclerospora sorghi]|uniref:Uncharacterized protein n=1 Tax=Peronosclerospora sorghi TaxID=230839 RepID=A0ACC0WUH7_9STRA|nr:hypothetical protein PsorP6_001680 [Peronosclerospora sorghi]